MSARSLAKLTDGQMARLKAVVLAPTRQQTRSGAGGPDRALAVVDLCRYVGERWEVSCSETRMLRRLWSLDLSHRKTRPRPPQSDEGAASLQKGGFAACLSEIARAHPEAERLEIWSQDEARVGQKRRTGYVWWQRLVAARPHPVRAARCRLSIGRDHRDGVPGARQRCGTGVDPARHRSDEPERSQVVVPGVHGVVLMDEAGWHTTGDLVVPENLSLVFLPPYSPELIPSNDGAPTLGRGCIATSTSGIARRLSSSKAHERERTASCSRGKVT